MLNENKMCETIYKAEGGVKAKKPYGVLHGYNTIRQCRESCYKKIEKYYKDFKKHGGFGIKNFINYSARRYVGSGGGVGEENWVKNVEYFYFLDKAKGIR